MRDDNGPNMLLDYSACGMKQGIQEEEKEQAEWGKIKCLDLNMLPLKCLWAIQVKLPEESLLHENDIQEGGQDRNKDLGVINIQMLVTAVKLDTIVQEERREREVG